MRTVKIPIKRIVEYINNPSGVSLVIPVIVNWPELKLTESQIIANSIALVNGEPIPFNDNSIFQIEMFF